MPESCEEQAQDAQTKQAAQQAQQFGHICGSEPDSYFGCTLKLPAAALLQQEGFGLVLFMVSDGVPEDTPSIRAACGGSCIIWPAYIFWFLLWTLISSTFTLEMETINSQLEKLSTTRKYAQNDG